MNGTLSPALEWALFLSLSTIAIGGAFRMVRTMSMVRSGFSLMASFGAIGGLFLILSADLLASMQIMMYVGGMLVMVLFMVMVSPDPGGSMMGIAPAEQTGPASEYFCPMHPDVRSPQPGQCPKCGMALQPAPSQPEHDGDAEHVTSEEHAHGQHMPMSSGMSMDMAMTQEFTRVAAVTGVMVTVALVAAIALVPWPAAAPLPALDSARTVGIELLGRYMIAFEGAALLILLGMVGAVIFARRV